MRCLYMFAEWANVKHDCMQIQMGKLPLTTRTLSEANLTMRDNDYSGSKTKYGSDAGTAAIKWGAIVIIVGIIVYFLARYIVPLLPEA